MPSGKAKQVVSLRADMLQKVTHPEPFDFYLSKVSCYQGVSKLNRMSLAVSVKRLIIFLLQLMPRAIYSSEIPLCSYRSTYYRTA